MLRRMTPSSAQLTGGDLSVDILHTEDSVQIGDGTNLLGTFSAPGGVRSLPVDVKATVGATDATLTGGTQKTQVVDAGGVVAEIDDVGGEKALKVSVIAQVGGGSGGTAATDEAAFSSGATQGTPMMGYYDADDSEDLTDGQLGIGRMTAERSLHVHQTNVISGFGTAANQTTIIGHLDGVEGLLGTIDADTGSMATLLGTIDADTGSIDTKLSTTNTHLGTLAGAVAGTEMQVDIVSSALPSGAATAANQTTIIGHIDGLEGLIGTTNTNTGNAATSLAILDDWDATAGNAHPSDGVMAMGSDGTLSRRLLTTTAGRLEVVVNTMSALVAGSANIGDVDIASIAAGDNNIGNVDIASIAAGDNNIGNVDIVTMPNVTGAAAHDAAISGNPVPIAGRAKNTNPTAVADGDATYIMTDLAGRVVTTPSDRALTVHATGTQTSTTAGTMIAAGGAGVFYDLSSIILTNSNTTTAAQVQIRDSAAGTTRFEHMIPPNSGLVCNFPVAMKQNTANNVWEIDLTAGVSTVYWTAVWLTRLA